MIRLAASTTEACPSTKSPATLPSDGPSEPPARRAVGSQCVAWLAAIVALWAGMAPGPVRADTVNDGGGWISAVTRGDFGEGDVRHRIKWWFDGQVRLTEDFGGFGQSLLRPGIGYATSGSTSVWAGYAWIYTSPGSGASTNEQRLWQQFWWTPKVATAAIDLRTRLEERWIDTGSNVGWRLRQLAGARMPLPFAPRFSPLVWNEIFFNLNDTDWGAVAGFDQNRLFVGFAFQPRPDSRFRLDVGYMNQYIDRPGRADLSNNLFVVTFYWSFATAAPRPAAVTALSEPRAGLLDR